MNAWLMEHSLGTVGDKRYVLVSSIGTYLLISASSSTYSNNHAIHLIVYYVLSAKKYLLPELIFMQNPNLLIKTKSIVTMNLLFKVGFRTRNHGPLMT